MSKSLPIEIKLKLSKRFQPLYPEYKFGRYSLKAIPTASSRGGEAILTFEDSFQSQPDGGGSHPEKEGQIICNFLALIADMRIKRDGLRVNGVDIPNMDDQMDTAYSQFLGSLDLKDVEKYLHALLTLNEDLARQFTRAARCYSFSLEFIPSDPSFAFFLLVVSIECLSSQEQVIPKTTLDTDSKKCERFCRFIYDFYPEVSRGEDERNSVLFSELLKSIYYSHRSGFVHGGKEVSDAALMADKIKSSYMKHSTDGKEVKTPGLGWFANIVRTTLLNFLSSLPSGKPTDEMLLAKLAFEKAALKFKVKRAVEKGAIVTFDDIEYR